MEMQRNMGRKLNRKKNMRGENEDEEEQDMRNRGTTAKGQGWRRSRRIAALMAVAENASGRGDMRDDAALDDATCGRGPTSGIRHRIEPWSSRRRCARRYAAHNDNGHVCVCVCVYSARASRNA